MDVKGETKGAVRARVGVPARKGELRAQGARLRPSGTARREGGPWGWGGAGMLGGWRQRFSVARTGTGGSRFASCRYA